jgi:hypothetical protein
MGFLNPKQQEEDDLLPGSDLHVDLDVRICPNCRREALPWQTECPDCGVATVAPTAIPADSFPLPGLSEPEAGDEPRVDDPERPAGD